MSSPRYSYKYTEQWANKLDKIILLRKIADSFNLTKFEKLELKNIALDIVLTCKGKQAYKLLELIHKGSW